MNFHGVLALFEPPNHVVEEQFGKENILQISGLLVF